jgi:hypothetical protein
VHCTPFAKLGVAALRTATNLLSFDLLPIPCVVIYQSKFCLGHKTQELSGGASHRHSILGFWFILANFFLLWLGLTQKYLKTRIPS